MAGGSMPDITPVFYAAFAAVGGAAGFILTVALLLLGVSPWAAIAAVPVSAGAFWLLAWWKR